MREKIVTPESVAAARDQLLSENQTPSLRTIRTKLGGGSLSTIHTVFKQVKTASPEIPIDTQERLRPLLTVGAELLMKASQDISSTLRAENKRISDDIDALAQSLQDTEASLEDLRAAQNTLQENYDSLKFNYDRTREQLEKTEAALDRTKEELIEARLSLEGCQEARREAKEACDRAAKLEGRLEVYEGKKTPYEDISPKKEGTTKKK
jgi:chromosome segregation ATPase